MKTKTKSFFIIFCTLLIGIIIGGLSTGIIRQKQIYRIDRMRPQQRFFKVMERVIKPNAEQRKAVEQILQKRFEKITDIREQYQNKIVDVFDSIHQDMESLLTDEQRERLFDMLKRGSGEVIRMRIDQLSDELELTEDQAREIEALLKDMEEIMMENRLNFRRKGRRAGRKFRAQFEEFNKKIESILTPEQLQKYQEMRESTMSPFDLHLGPPRGKGPPKHMFDE